MPSFKLAHIREQGNDMIIVPVDGSFDSRSNRDQQAVRNEIQVRAASAGLRGEVVLVWENFGRMKFLAPQPWHPFFRSISMDFVEANINRDLYW